MMCFFFVTVPAGKYRLVMFISFPEKWVGEKDKWYKMPMMDSLGGGETLNGMEPYDKRHFEKVPMEKSPYKDIDIVEVIDRKATQNTAPRWYMGFIYDDENAYNKGNYTFEYIRRWSVGNILQITSVNTTNQMLRGTIVAKAEYLPMYNPIGYWRLDQTAKYHGSGQKKGGSYYYTPWSFEIGQSDVLLNPNQETKVVIEINNWDFKEWSEIGGRGVTYIGPEYFIHFYWIDEFGNESMMMRVDYPMINKMQELNIPYIKVPNRQDFRSQRYPDVPERYSISFSNGFVI